MSGLLSAECLSGKHLSGKQGSYLTVTVHPSDPRTDDIAGDLVINGEASASCLQLIDANLAMDDLVNLPPDGGFFVCIPRPGREPMLL